MITKVKTDSNSKSLLLVPTFLEGEASGDSSKNEVVVLVPNGRNMVNPHGQQSAWFVQSIMKGLERSHFPLDTSVVIVTYNDEVHDYRTTLANCGKIVLGPPNGSTRFKPAFTKIKQIVESTTANRIHLIIAVDNEELLPTSGVDQSDWKTNAIVSSLVLVRLETGKFQIPDPTYHALFRCLNVVPECIDISFLSLPVYERLSSSAEGKDDGEDLAEAYDRVKAKGGKTGKCAHFTLSWKNTNDLDIHAIVTHVNGVQDKIYYGTKSITKSGFAGFLDVDANVSHDTHTPVENIYIDDIPSGSKIKVVVNFFSKGNQSPLETPFTFIATINNAIEAFVDSELHTVKGEVTVWEKIYEAPLVFVDTIDKCPPVPPQHEKSYGRLVDKVSATLTKGRTMKFMKLYPSFATILSPRNVSSDGSVLITENYPILIELPDALEGVAPSVTMMPVFGDLESKATVVLDEVLVMDNPDRRAIINLCVSNMVDYCKYLSLVSAAFNPDSKEAKQLKALMSTIEKYIVDFKVDEERKEDKDESVSQIGMKMKERMAVLKTSIRKGQKMTLNQSLQLLNASNIAKLNSAQKSELLQSRGMIPNTRAGRGLAKRVGADFDLDQCMIDCLNAVSKESDRVCPGRSIFSLEDCNDTIAGATTLKGEILNASGSSAVVDSSILQTALLSNLGIPGYSLKLLITEHNFVFPEPFQFQDIMSNILEVYPTVCNTNDPILAAAYRNDGHPDSVLRCPGQGDSEILGCVPTLGTAGDFIFSKGGSQLVNIITSYQLRGVVAPVPKDYEAFLVGAIRSILSKGGETLKFSWCKDMLKDLVNTLIQKMEYSKASYEEITNTFEALFPQDSFTADNAPNKYLASMILYGQKHLGKRGAVLSVLVRCLYHYSLWCNIRHYFNNVAKPSEEGKESTRNDLFDLVLKKIDRHSTFPIPGPYATSAIPVSEIKCLKVDDKLLEAACTEIIEPLGILPSSDFFGNLNSYLLHDIHKIPVSTSVLETEEVSLGCWNDKKWVMSAVLQTLKFPMAADRFRTDEQSIIAAGGLKSKVIDPTTPAEVDGVIVDVISTHFVQKLQEACRSHATNLIAERKQECIDDLVDGENMTEFTKGLLRGDMKVGMSDYELLLKYCDPPIATELFGISVKFKREKCLEVVRERFDACDEELRSRFKIREKIWFLLFGCTFDFYNTTGELYDAAVDLHPYQGEDFRSIVDATLITFPKIEEAYAHMEATRKWVYRAMDKPNRHGYCNSNPSEWALCYGKYRRQF